MADFKFSPFRTTRLAQSEIQEFLDLVSMAVLAYQEGMVAYLKEGWLAVAEEKLQQIAAYESRGDSLRTHIGLTLYTEMLLPDTSADILSLLPDLDHLLDLLCKKSSNNRFIAPIPSNTGFEPKLINHPMPEFKFWRPA